jgi:Arc/MetJ-type ribon-helix-helix transcriptional regulator
MPVAKIAVSLPGGQVAAVRRAVAAGRARSFSAYLSTALERRLREDSLAALVRDMVAARGAAPSKEDHAWAERALLPRRRGKASRSTRSR